MCCLQEEISYFLPQYELRLKVYLKLSCINSYLSPERKQDRNDRLDLWSRCVILVILNRYLVLFALKAFKVTTINILIFTYFVS